MFLYVLAISADNKNPQLEKKRSRFSFLKKTFEFFETKLREWLKSQQIIESYNAVERFLCVLVMLQLKVHCGRKIYLRLWDQTTAQRRNLTGINTPKK